MSKNLYVLFLSFLLNVLVGLNAMAPDEELIAPEEPAMESEDEEEDTYRIS